MTKDVVITKIVITDKLRYMCQLLFSINRKKI